MTQQGRELRVVGEYEVRGKAVEALQIKMELPNRSFYPGNSSALFTPERPPGGVLDAKMLMGDVLNVGDRAVGSKLYFTAKIGPSDGAECIDTESTPQVTVWDAFTGLGVDSGVPANVSIRC